VKEWSRLKKAAVISAVTFFGIGGIGALTDNQNSVINPTPTPDPAPLVQGQNTITQPTAQPAPQPEPLPTPTPVPSPEPAQLSCPNGSYTNVDGVEVCSPYASPSTPTGATAQCVDGTYSFSLHHSGTCSHHGGVATWL
jgi:hypothetical protein